MNTLPNMAHYFRADSKEPMPRERGWGVCDRLLVHAGMGSLPNLDFCIRKSRYILDIFQQGDTAPISYRVQRSYGDWWEALVGHQCVPAFHIPSARGSALGNRRCS